MIAAPAALLLDSVLENVRLALLPTIESVVAGLSARGVKLPPGPVALDGFGDSPELSRSLLDLIRAGHKRAGTSLLWSHEADGEPPPRAGDFAIVLDHEHRPALITRCTRVLIVPFNEVTAEYAAIEGEGDKSLEYWREGHWSFFSRECRRLGREPAPTMPVVCVEFELIRVLL